MVVCVHYLTNAVFFVCQFVDEFFTVSLFFFLREFVDDLIYDWFVSFSPDFIIVDVEYVTVHTSNIGPWQQRFQGLKIVRTTTSQFLHTD
ncbi:hypothetical protein VNO78_20787 [Psophocarpus tetragonolobus]|uniref:Uncharacterized protein n=1 Tax=Psophocarpus tetragonolobus TaxID=3891 RepID=A0AAN9SAK0_PSOTE